MVLTLVLCAMVLTHDTHQAAKIERATCRNCGLDYIVQDNLVGSCKCAHNGSTSQVPLLSTALSPPRAREREGERELHQEISITGGLGRRPRTDSESPRYGLLPHTPVVEYQPTWRRLSPDSDQGRETERQRDREGLVG